MSAKFHAIGTFAIEARNLFVVYGDVIEGVVNAGMFLNIPFNASLSMTVPIHSIETLSGAAGTHVGLTFTIEDESQAELWHELNIGDEMLDITEEAESSKSD